MQTDPADPAPTLLDSPPLGVDGQKGIERGGVLFPDFEVGAIGPILRKIDPEELGVLFDIVGCGLEQLPARPGCAGRDQFPWRAPNRAEL